MTLALLTTMTDADREQELLAILEVVERWGSFALVCQRDTGDEELWSVREGFLRAVVAQRLPAAQRDAFAEAHRRSEARLWAALVEAARLASTPGDTHPDAAGREQPDDRRSAGELSSARWRLAGAHRAYRRAGTPPRAAVPAAVRRAVVADWEAGGRRCGICGQTVREDEPVELDHILPVSLGGGAEASNLRVAHAVCNGKRSAWQWDAAEPLAEVRLRLEPPHPSPCALLACWICGARTRGYVDVPGLPTFRLCSAHSGWETVRGLLAGHRVPANVLDRVRYIGTESFEVHGE